MTIENLTREREALLSDLRAAHAESIVDKTTKEQVSGYEKLIRRCLRTIREASLYALQAYSETITPELRETMTRASSCTGVDPLETLTFIETWLLGSTQEFHNISKELIVARTEISNLASELALDKDKINSLLAELQRPVVSPN